ncbi:hypothetical protein BDZ94DRAFT_1252361 [Collybia nuda]|uniref:Uncharacterized protein n=1 Tax=Collybia nuda TaxID=64659 RepID=A0A9P5YCL4_9AGAR|nr:hypothetical protein BDZ94DRAFT_1252361 [Collybia nuda]
MQALRDQVASSPVQASPEQPNTPSSFPSSPCPASGTVLSYPESRKRPLEDMTQFASTVSRSFKLQKKDRDELNMFTKYDPIEQQIWLAASMLKVQEQQATMTPPDAIYVIPKNLENKIEHYSFVILLDPTIASYIHQDGPLKMITDLLDQNPSWGLTPAVKDNKSKYDVIVTRVCGRLTSRRYDIKKILGDSLGKISAGLDGNGRVDATDIVTLCQALVKIYRSANITVTVQLCARIAFLRYLIAEKPTGRFWEGVDKELLSTRTDLPSAARQSRFFGSLLKLDRETYGDADLDELSLPFTSGCSQVLPSATPIPRSTMGSDDAASAATDDNEEEED